MPISRSVTNGLAWAGLVVVVGVPAADFLLSRISDPSALVTRVEAEPEAGIAETVLLVAPEADAAEIEPFDPVAAYLATGRDLPAYIAGQETFVPPAEGAALASFAAVSPSGPQAAEPAPGERIAPVPMPLSMRPAPVEALFIPGSVLAQSSPQPVVSVSSNPERWVGPEELAGWQSGTLADFLAGRSGAGSSADYDPGYDPRGFAMDETQAGSSALFRTEPAPITGVWPLR